MKLHRVNVIGYFREANVWLDSTNGHNMPRFPDLNGNAYPSDNVNGGADGFTAKDCMLFGGLWGMRVQGPEPKAGSDAYETNYYDELSGGLVSDRRGSFGCSDLYLEGCQIYGPQHYSHLRRVDMTEVGDPVADVEKGVRSPLAAWLATALDVSMDTVTLIVALLLMRLLLFV